MIPHEYESELVWNKDPSKLDYIGEIEIKTRKKKGISKDYDADVYGWTDLEFDAPPIGINEIYSKRIFISDYEGKEINNLNIVKVDSIGIGEKSTIV